MKKNIVNILWLSIDKATTLFGSLIVTVFVARYLGPEKMGVFNLALAIIAFILPISQFGIEHLIYNKVSKSNEDAICFIKHTEPLRVLLFICGFFIILIYINSSDYNIESKRIIFTLLFFSFFSCLDVYKYYFDATVNSKLNTYCSQIGFHLSWISRIILVYFKVNVIWFCIPFIINMVIPFLLRYVIFNREKVNKNRNKISEASKELFKSGLPLAISSLSVIVYTRISQIFLASFLDTKTVGIYNAALVLGQSWVFIPMSILLTFMTKVLSDKDDLRNGFSFISLLMLISSLPFIIICFLFSDSIIRYSFGYAFIDASKFIFIIALSSLLSVFGTLTYRLMIYLSGARYLMIKTIFCAIINITLSWFLIPKYGISGAVISLFVTELLSLTVMNYFFKNGYIFTLHKNVINYKRFIVFYKGVYE
ncbi:flippase [Photobacterium damselae]|uniref:flippase n=1 Tax=Photobacterium damselae TaxID=38293 RepID=UPI00370C6440